MSEVPQDAFDAGQFLADAAKKAAEIAGDGGGTLVKVEENKRKQGSDLIA